MSLSDLSEAELGGFKDTQLDYDFINRQVITDTDKRSIDYKKIKKMEGTEQGTLIPPKGRTENKEGEKMMRNMEEEKERDESEQITESGAGVMEKRMEKEESKSSFRLKAKVVSFLSPQDGGTGSVPTNVIVPHNQSNDDRENSDAEGVGLGEKEGERSVVDSISNSDKKMKMKMKMKMSEPDRPSDDLIVDMELFHKNRNEGTATGTATDKETARSRRKNKSAVAKVLAGNDMEIDGEMEETDLKEMGKDKDKGKRSKAYSSRSYRSYALHGKEEDDKYNKNWGLMGYLTSFFTTTNSNDVSGRGKDRQYGVGDEKDKLLKQNQGPESGFSSDSDSDSSDEEVKYVFSYSEY